MATWQQDDDDDDNDDHGDDGQDDNRNWPYNHIETRMPSMATCQMHHDDKDGLHREFDHDEVRDGQDDDDNRN